MKKGQVFMTIESRLGAKKTKSNYSIELDIYYSSINRSFDVLAITG
jgi:hypothetical protein